MGVYLREKKVGNGKVSCYLDIYHNKTRWYEFLKITLNKAHPTPQDKEKKQLAQEIRAKRETELIIRDNGLIDRSRGKTDFLVWFQKYVKDKNCLSTHNQATINNLKKYLGTKPLTFSAITPEWIKGFTSWLMGRVKHNTVRNYLMDMSTGLEDAVRQDIIPFNPFRKLPRKDRVRQQETFKKAYTLEELQLLAETPCKEIHPQIRQGYLFACFCGLRWSDVNPLRWSEIITKKIDGKEEWFISFTQEKTEGVEYMPLSEQAVEILQDRKEEARNERDSPCVFPFIKEYNEKTNLMNAKVNRALKKWASAAGLNPDEMHFHTSRHSFATNLLEHSPEADLWTVSKLLGHKSIGATQIYTKVRDKRKTAAVKGLPKLNLRIVHSKVA